MPSVCDVLVIGGGPAGATAARTLALGGARVRILDRCRFPRNKPCGGAISLRVLRRFPYLTSALRQIPTHLISRLYLESPGGESVTLESDGPAALMIRRVEFDRVLIALAQQAGAELLEGVEVAQATERANTVEVRTRRGDTFSAPAVIAADGVNSVIARRLGFNPGWHASTVALDMMEETPSADLRCADPGTLWVGYGYRGAEGYAYVFPKAHHVNVGIGYRLSYFRDMVPDRPYDLQRQFVSHLRDRGALEGASIRQNFTPFLIPVGGPLTETRRGRVLLIGDAGGFVSGFTAEGIYYAMVTGELAAQALLRDAPDSYARAWRREIGAELRDSVIVQRYLFRKAGRIDGMVRGARTHRAVAAAIVDYARGERSYRSARRYLLARSPLLAARLAVGFLGRRQPPAMPCSQAATHIGYRSNP